MPWSMDPWMASSSATEIVGIFGPRLMLATAGLMAFAVTQSTPLTICDHAPEPPQFRTRTETSETPFATPYADPPTMPATCVACPDSETELGMHGAPPISS